MNFKLSEVVQLKSGGPKMTIIKIIGQNTSRDENFRYQIQGYNEGDLICEWFVDDVLKNSPFNPSSVDLV
jgi:uncharacterized protein YodC (DUF2158 family)